MSIIRLSKSLKRPRSQRRTGVELAQTMSVVSQMALLCPSGMDIWMQRELTAGFELERPRAARR